MWNIRIKAVLQTYTKIDNFWNFISYSDIRKWDTPASGHAAQQEGLNDATAASFWRKNYIIIVSRVRWDAVNHEMMFKVFPSLAGFAA